jgi:hypothetical protein
MRAHRAPAEIAHTQLDRRVTAIRAHREVMATAHTRRVRPAMATARTLPALRALAATALTLPALLATAHARIVRATIARVLIDPMATSRGVNGSPRAVNDVRSARR